MFLLLRIIIKDGSLSTELLKIDCLALNNVFPIVGQGFFMLEKTVFLSSITKKPVFGSTSLSLIPGSRP